MRRALKLHPDSHCDAVSGIEVDIARPRPHALILRYSIRGKVADIAWPPRTAPIRADELWRHTCFEAFVREGSGERYFECNFAPSTQWAMYAFSDYRSEMRRVERTKAPRIVSHSDDAHYELDVSVEFGAAPDATTWRLGLSAVIVETNGRISWWALSHPPGKPDFHHSDCFALTLPAPLQP
jgi:hypothetical protein